MSKTGKQVYFEVLNEALNRCDVCIKSVYAYVEDFQLKKN